MTLTALTLALVSLILSVTIHERPRWSASRRRQQQAGLEALRVIRGPLERVAKHRGMANTYLRGDTSFKTKMEQMQQALDGDFEKLDALASAYGIGDLRSHWATLRKSVYSMTPEDSFTAHSRLVAELLEALTRVARSANLTQMTTEGARALTPILAGHLPVTVENIGMARGIGAGVAAQKSCNAAARIQLKFITRRVHDATDQMGTAFAEITLADGNYAHGLETAIAEAIEASLEFLDVLEEKIINSSSIDIAADDYFQLGTKAIDKNLTLFDSLIARLIAASNTAIATGERNTWIGRIAAITLGGAGIFVAAQIGL